jgi:nitric oxide reductase activation protein
MHNDLENTLQKVGRVLSDTYGITVICRGTDCCTNGKVIYLPALPDEIPDQLMGVIRAYLDHEVGHIVGNSDMELAGKFQKEHGQEAFGVLNTLEDLRIERLMRELYAGCGLNLRTGYEHAVEKLRSCADQLSPLKQVLTAAFSRGSNQADLDFLDPHAYRIADALSSIISKSIHAKDTAEVYTFSEEAWAIIQKMLPEMPAYQEETTQEAEKEEQTGSETQQQAAQQMTHSSGSPMDNLSEIIQQSAEEHAVLSQTYRVWDNSHDIVHTPRCKSGASHHDLLSAVLPYVSGVRQRLIQSLKAQSINRWLGDQESGAVNPRTLHRLITGASARIFRKRVRSQTKSTAASLLIDLSGSMRGRKLELARHSALVFCEALDKLNIPTSVIGFNTTNETKVLEEAMQATNLPEQELLSRYRFLPLRHTLFKHFHEPWRNVSSRFLRMKNQGVTPLGESLRFTALQLADRPEERKVILCLTDGRPVAGVTNEDLAFTHARKSILQIEKAGIEIVLIGICESCVKNLHSKHVIINSLSELPGSVIRELQKLLLPGTLV